MEMVVAKKVLAEWDRDGIFPNHLPELAAEPEAIESAEAALGVVLDGEHRRFISFADGWKCFHQKVSLFGTQELVDGPLRAAALQSFEYAPELLEDYGWSPALLLPIAASLEQADVFVMPVGDRGRVDPRVHWLAEGELIDTFETFGQFFVSMIDHTTYRVAKLRESASAEDASGQG